MTKNYQFHLMIVLDDLNRKLTKLAHPSGLMWLKSQCQGRLAHPQPSPPTSHPHPRCRSTSSDLSPVSPPDPSPHLAAGGLPGFDAGSRLCHGRAQGPKKQARHLPVADAPEPTARARRGGTRRIPPDSGEERRRGTDSDTGR